VGQSKLKKVLEISINGANAREEALGHVLFVGPPGLGKTTLANIIAEATKRGLITASATSLTKVGALATLLNQLVEDEDGKGVLFIDEIHRLPRVVEESLYSVMEDFRLDVTTEKMHINMKLPKFTLVGATTRMGLMTKPLRDRFLLQHQLDWYTIEELEQIAKRTAGILKLTIDDQAAHELATRCKRTPRLINNLMLQARDFAQSYGIHDQINYAVVLGMMETLEIDNLGLTSVDRSILQIMIERFDGGPVGLDTLAVTMVEEPDVLERVYEPYLLQESLIERTPRGRVVTKRGYEHLKARKKMAAFSKGVEI